MLDFLETIPAEWRPLALLIFVVGGGISAVLTYHRGKKAGPEAPKVQEFYASGQLADMGPVKSLIEQTGLLVQQQVRTNMALEANIKKQGQTAIALQSTSRQLGRLADAYEAAIKEQQHEREIEEEVERRLKEKR